MLEGVVANLLNKLLGGYVDNLETNQLRIGIWRGDVNLTNLQLRKDALDGLHLPINISKGQIKSLTLSIPWSNLRGQPVKLIIEGLDLECKLKLDKRLSEEEEMLESIRAQAQKMKELNELELLMTSSYYQDDSKTGDSSYYGQLVAKIIDNLQITIKDIHIKYTDTHSNSKRNFSTGIVLQSLSMVSTNEEWSPTFIQNQGDTMFKLISLDNLFIYHDNKVEIVEYAPKLSESQEISESPEPGHLQDPFNPSVHQAIINPISGTAKLLIHNKSEKSKGKINLSLAFDQFAVTLDEYQYQDILLLATNLHHFQTRAKYRKFLPHQGVTPLLDPRAWLQFALKSVLYEIKEKRDRWIWENIKEKCQMRRIYIRLYIMSKTKSKLSDTDAASLTELEEKLSFDEIKLFRQLAIPAIRKYNLRQKQKQSEDNTGTDTASAKAPSQPSWVGGWVQWASGTNKTELEPDEPVITEEEINDLVNALESSDVGSDKYDLMSEGTVFRADAVLGRGLLELKSVDGSSYHTILSVLGSSVKADLFQLANNMVVDLTVEDFRVDDGTVPNSAFPQMIKMRKIESLDDANVTPFLKVKYEQNPLDGHSDSMAQVTAQGLDVVFNPAAIKELGRFFKPPSESASSVQALVEATSRSMAGLQDYTTTGIAYAIRTHKRFDLQIDFQAPVFIFPSDVCDPNSFVTVLDLGHLIVSSDFVSSELVKKMTDYSEKLLDERSKSEFRDLIFDWLSIKLEKTQLIVGPTFGACSDTILNQKTNSKLHVVNQVELNFRLGTCILSDRPIHIPQVIIDGHLPNLQVLFSDLKYSMLMKTVDIIVATFGNQDQSSDLSNGLETEITAPTLNIFSTLSTSAPSESIGLLGIVKSRSQIHLSQVDSSTLSAPSKSPVPFRTSGIMGNNLLSSLNSSLVHNRKPSTSPAAAVQAKDPNESSDSDDSDSDQFFDTTDDIFYDSTLEPDLSNNKSSTEFFPPDEQKVEDPEQAGVNLSFTVDNLTVILYESNTDPEKDDLPIANAAVTQFQLEVENRNLDMDVKVIIHQVIIEDLMTKYTVNSSPFSNKPKYILYSSSSGPDAKNGTSNPSNENHLVSVNYKRTQLGHPSFQPGSSTVGQKIDIAISAIHFTLIRKTVLNLYNYILTTFTGGNNKSPQNTPRLEEGRGNPVFSSETNANTFASSVSLHNQNQENSYPNTSNNSYRAQESTDSKDNDTQPNLDNEDTLNKSLTDNEESFWVEKALQTIKVNVSLKGIDFDLCDDSGSSIALLEINMGTASVTIAEEMVVDAKIGELSLIDRHNLNQVATMISDYNIYLQQRKIICIKGQELLDFSYRTFNKSKPQYPGHDALLELNVGTMYMVFAQAPIRRLIRFAEKFAVMHVLFEKARNDMAIGATQITETVVQGSNRTKINLMLSSPVISFFQDGKMPFELITSGVNSNNNSIVAHLGQLSITNDFVKAVETKKYVVEVNSFRIQLENISISSNFHYYLGFDHKDVEQSLDILENVTLDANLGIVLGGRNSQSILPETKVTSLVSQLCMNLTLQQYCFIMEMLNVASNTFNGPVNADLTNLGLCFEEDKTMKSLSVLEVNHLNDAQNQGTKIANQPPTLASDNATQEPGHRQTSSSKQEDSQDSIIETPFLDFVLTLPKIQLEVYDSNPLIMADLQKSTFTRMDLIDLQVKYRKKFDESSILEFSLGSIRAFDTRLASQNYYTQFIGPRDNFSFLRGGSVGTKSRSPSGNSTKNASHDIDNSEPSNGISSNESKNEDQSIDIPQMLIQFDMEPSSPTVIRGTLNSPRVIFAPDHVFQQLKFFLAPFANQSQPESQQKQESDASAEDETESVSLDNQNNPSLVLKVNIISPELIIFADPTSVSSQALILSIRELCIEMHGGFTCSIDDIDMILCQMNQRAATSRSIIDPISIVAMYNQQTNTHLVKSKDDMITSTEVDVSAEVSQLTVRIGFQDMDIVLSIINELNSLIAKVGQQTNAQNQALDTNPAPSKESSKKSSQSSLLRSSIDEPQSDELSDKNQESCGPSPIIVDEGQNQVSMVSEKLTVTVGGIRAIIIHDKLDLPVLNMNLEQFCINATDWSSSLIVSSDMALQVTFFNFHNSRWEPIVEMWQFSVNMCNEKMNLALPKSVSNIKETVSHFIRVSVGSNERLEIDVAHASIESLVDLFMNLGGVKVEPSNDDIIQEPESNTKENNAISTTMAPTYLQNPVGLNNSNSIKNGGDTEHELTKSPEIHSISKAPTSMKVGKLPTSDSPDVSKQTLENDQIKKLSDQVQSDKLAANLQETIHTKGQKHPYLIINKTGLDCYIWVDLPQGAPTSQTSQLKPILLKSGDSVPWSFESNKTQRESLKQHGSQLGLQFANGLWEWTRRIEAGVEGVKYYKLSPEVDGINHLLAIDVSLDNTQLVKNVLLRSTLVVENETIIPIEICMVDYKGKIRSDYMKIQPHESIPLPLMLSHQYAFKTRPEASFGYKWSDQSMYWRDFLGTKSTHILTCLPVSALATSMPQFNINFSSTYDNKNGKVYQHPLMKITISSPLEIENLLPYSIQFRVLDSTDNSNWSNVLPSGEVSSVHSVKPNHLVLMSIRIPDANFDKCDGCVIETDNSDDYPIESEIVLYDQSGNKLSLMVNRSTVKYTNGSYSRVSIVSPYILINRTSLPILLQSKSFLRGATSVAGQQDIKFQSEIFSQVEVQTNKLIKQNQKMFYKQIVKKTSDPLSGTAESNNGAEINDLLDDDCDQYSWSSIQKINSEIKPLMFSADGYDIRNMVLMKAGNSEWSKPISLDTVGYSAELKIPAKKKASITTPSSMFGSFLSSSSPKPTDKTNLHLGIQISPGIGKFSNTKFVVFSPRFIIKNNSGLPLFFKEAEGTDPTSLEPGQIVPIPYLSAVESIKMSLAINVASVHQTLEYANKSLKNRDNNAELDRPLWSSPFLINQIGKVYVRLTKPQSLAIYEAAPPDDDDAPSIKPITMKLNSIPLELTSVLLGVNIVMEDECIFIIVNRETGEWPYRVDNWTGFDITFWQASLKLEGGQQTLARAQPISKSNSVRKPSIRSSRLSISSTYNSRKDSVDSASSPLKKYTVMGYHSMPYTWDCPEAVTKYVYISICGQARKVPIQEIGFRTSFYVYPKCSDTNKVSYKNRIIIAVEVVAQGSQQVLKVVSNDLKTKRVSPGLSGIDSSVRMLPDSSDIVPEVHTNSPGGKTSYFQPTDNVGLSIDSENVYAQSVYSHTTASPDQAEPSGLDDVMTFMFELSLDKGIGISLISKDIVEIMYASFNGVDLKIQESPQASSFTLQVQWLQIDNQLYGALYPIVIYPTIFPKRASARSETYTSTIGRGTTRSDLNNAPRIKPVIQLAVVRSKADYSNSYKNNYVLHKNDSNQPTNHIKYASILIQELSIKLDEDFLLALLDFSIFNFGADLADSQEHDKETAPKSNEMSPSWLSALSNATIDLENLFSPSIYSFNAPPASNFNFLANISDAIKITRSIPIPNYTVDKTEEFFFDLLMLQPVKLNISFLRTEKMAHSPTNSAKNMGVQAGDYFNPVEYMVNVLTMVIGNVNDVPIYFNALILENAKVSVGGLNDRLATFYKNEFMSQLFKVVGSADVLGNPVGLFNSISSGVVDIFYEPYQGIMMSDRPQDFGRGLAKGAASFVKKTVYGFSDSMSRFTDSVGKGLSAATLDTEYQSQRRMQKVRNRPQHAFSGMSRGAEALARSVTSGITGVVMQPISGAEKDGVGGFFAGVGKGLVGVVTKPVAGLFDMASNISEGIKNTTLISEPTELDRQRLPRYVNTMKVLEPYDKEKSLGLSWMRELKKGKYAYDDYLAHLELENSDLAVLLTYQRIVMFKKFRNRTLSSNQSVASTPKVSLYDATIEWEVNVRDLHSVILETSGISLKLPANASRDKVVKSDSWSLAGTATSTTGTDRKSKAENLAVTKHRSSISKRSPSTSIDLTVNAGLFIPISNQATRRWFYSRIEEAIKDIGNGI